MSVRPLIAASLLLAVAAGCGRSSSNSIQQPAPPPETNADFRAIAGISMGAYGAMNLGTKHTDMFGTIVSLGGPVDMTQMLLDIQNDNLEVKPQTEIPRDVGSDFTLDHLPPYPDRDTRVRLIQDLVISFGNPFLHNPDPQKQYLASDSEPAMILRDDRFGTFTVPSDPRGFMDGGDANDDGLREVGEAPAFPTDVLLLAGGSLASIAPEAQGVEIGGRNIADLNGDGVFDVGDGVVLNASEPFDDANGNGVFDAGESYSDFGLDGVDGTGDFGEGNGVFDYDPDRQNWLNQDPLTRLAGRSADAIRQQRIYMDVGTEDAFGFARHYTNFVAMLRGKGIDVQEFPNFVSGNCIQVPSPTADFILARYPGGHVGIPTVDSIEDNLLNADFCGPTTIWRRLLGMIGFLNESFPNGDFGPDGADPRGDTVEMQIPSPALATSADAAAPLRDVLVYRPPAFFNTPDRSFPVVYYLGGYGQSPGDYERMRELMDLLIGTGQVQNMYLAFLPGSGGRKGSLYVNHVVDESQVPDITNPTSGRYEDSIIQDLIPRIENDILNGRVRAG